MRDHKFEFALVKEDTAVGANAAIVSEVTMGKYAVDDARAGVREDAPGYAIAIGASAKKLRKGVST